MSELSLKIQGQRFDFFNEFEVSLVYNGIASTFSFSGLKLADDQRELFRHLSFHDVHVLFGDEKLITGIALNTTTSVDNNVNSASISGYSKTGVLEDCEIPVSLYPLQSDGLSLRQIIEKIIKSFGLKLVVHTSVIAQADKIYETSTAEHEQKIVSYFAELTKQRNVILTHDNLGNVVLTKLNLNEHSVATYTENMPTTKITVSANGQSMHSEITVQKQASIGTDAEGQQTATNSLIKKYRPTVKKQSSGDNSDTEDGAEMIRSSELRNISLTIETDRWKWTDGKRVSIIKPNHIIEVESPSNFINKKTRFFVEKISYKGNNEGISAVIQCVLPEVYNGKQPKNIFI